jgi:hypothetical protein
VIVCVRTYTIDGSENTRKLLSLKYIYLFSSSDNLYSEVGMHACTGKIRAILKIHKAARPRMGAQVKISASSHLGIRDRPLRCTVTVQGGHVMVDSFPTVQSREEGAPHSDLPNMAQTASTIEAHDTRLKKSLLDISSSSLRPKNCPN